MDLDFVKQGKTKRLRKNGVFYNAVTAVYLLRIYKYLRIMSTRFAGGWSGNV